MNRATNVLISICFLVPSLLTADDGQVRQAFSDFYLPKQESLDANYSNIRFQAAHCLISKTSSIKHYDGSFTPSGYIYRTGPRTWKVTSDLSSYVWSQGFQPFEVGKVNAWNGEYGFRFSEPLSGRSRPSTFFTLPEYEREIDGLLATTISPAFRRPYATFIDDPRLEFLELSNLELDVKQQDGTSVKQPARLLRIRDKKRSSFNTYQYYFLEQTGACAALVEFTQSGDGDVTYRHTLELSFSFDQDLTFPPLRSVDVLDETVKGGSTVERFAWFVFQYDRVGQIPASEFSIERFGFDKPVTAAGIAEATSHVLVRVTLVLAALLAGIVFTLFASVYLLRKLAAARE